MSERSINGWPVIHSRSDEKLKTLTIPGTRLRLTMHHEVVPLFCALASDYNNEVAKLRAGECGAYTYRKSRLAEAWSDHSSGTAVDLNWNHEGAMGPNGGMKTMSDKQIAACAEIKKRYRIMIWGGDRARGGDYRQPQNWDPMHYALKPGTTVEDVRKVIERLNINDKGVRLPKEETPKNDVPKVTQNR